MTKTRRTDEYSAILLGRCGMSFQGMMTTGVCEVPTCARHFTSWTFFPSHSQIQEMVHCAVEYGSPCDADHVTFGEFCVLASELEDKYASNAAFSLPQALYPSNARRLGSTARRKRKDSSPNFQVFLGGSCGSSKGPTTWRQERAIPHFKQHNITFYNPQVNTWRPELIELEDRAKQVAELLLFVIDNRTRAVVSLCEIAYLVGCGRQIVVMFTDLHSEVTEVNEETLTQREREDISRGRRVLVDLIQRNGIPVFSDLTSALNCCVLNLAQGVRVQDLTLKQGAEPVKFGHCLVGEALLKLRETFNSITCDSEGKITKKDLQLGYRCVRAQELKASWLQRVRPHATAFTFEEFCCIVAEYKHQKASCLSQTCSALLSPFIWLHSLCRLPGRRVSSRESGGDVYDIYLGGSCGETEWRQGIALPIIKRHGLSYHNPHVTEWFNRLIPMQVAEREKCRLMLYVITCSTRALSAMIEAAYYMGLGCRVVLCMQFLKPAALVMGEEMTEAAVKDYNRGRAYLSDMASRQCVPQFDDIAEAVHCAIKQVKDMSQERP